MKRFEGKVVIVVGAAGHGNMGQCIARRFAGEGASVIVAGRRAEPLDHLASEIGGASRLCDFTRKEDVEALVAFAQSATATSMSASTPRAGDFSGRSKTRVRKHCRR
ncbi:NAD(P)-dependent dehydrogenase (short-subunit alcohol dehydrogenase family) [Paraburkholderia sp. Clong3]